MEHRFSPWLLCCLAMLSHCYGEQTYMIGGVLSSEESSDVFKKAIRNLNFEPRTRIPGITFNATTIIMNGNPIKSALSVCRKILNIPVYAVVVSHPPNMPDTPPISVSFTCGFYNIPVIGLSARDSIFSDMNLHMTYMRTVPPFSHQAKVWLQFVHYNEWKSVIIMHSADQEGRAMVARFQNEQENKKMSPETGSGRIIDQDRIQVAKLINFVVGEPSYSDQLSFTEDTRVILLSASPEDAVTIFRDATAMNMTGSGYVWIVNEQAMSAHNVPLGVLAVRLKDSQAESAHIADAVRIVGQGFKKAHNDGVNMTAPPSDCVVDTEPWSSGRHLSDILRSEQLLDGRTGHVVFDEFGDRMLPVYEIVNKQEYSWRVVGHYGNSTDESKPITMNEVPIIWPGGETQKPAGMLISTHLRVVTLESVPFVFTRNVASRNECLEGEAYCPKLNSSEPGGETHYCCKGYCIEMLKKMSQFVNFTYDVHLVSDGLYGSLEKRDGSSRKEWNGMVGEIIRGLSDLIVAPMTITPERAKDIDFTKPFKYQGMTILVRKEQKNSNLASFLQPFQDTLWILVGLSVHVVALVLYLLDRFSPFGRFKLAKSNDAEEDALNLSSAMWFAWGVLLNSGIGEGTPRSFSARVLGMVWAGFAMIIVASYTANLAAFLVLDRPEASISGIDDARLRNPEEDYNYATVKNSAVEMYFRRQVELSTMYRTMQKANYLRPEEAINDVKTKKLQAFIWDSSRLEYEAAKNCDLVTAGEMFGRSGFGVGMRQNSQWLKKISLSILNMHEIGFMEELDTNWILVKAPHCPQTDQSPATLGLTNMAGVFMLVAGGILTGVMLIFIEILYKRRRGMKEKEMELAKTAADRWRGNIEARKLRRRLNNKLRTVVLDENGTPAQMEGYPEYPGCPAYDPGYPAYDPRCPDSPIASVRALSRRSTMTNYSVPNVGYEFPHDNRSLAGIPITPTSTRRYRDDGSIGPVPDDRRYSSLAPSRTSVHAPSRSSPAPSGSYAQPYEDSDNGIWKRKTLRRTLMDGKAAAAGNHGNHQPSSMMTSSTSRVPLTSSGSHHDDDIMNAPAPPYPTSATMTPHGGVAVSRSTSRKSLGAVSNPVYDGNFYEAV